MLRIYHSNTTEKLLQRLLDVTGLPLSSPFVPECVVVQNQGMARWLACEIARQRGIAANYQFPFPASFFWSVFQGQFEQLPDRSPFDKEQLVWSIFNYLRDDSAVADLTPLSHYIGADQRDLKPYQLARKIADVFDQYLVYRPEMLRGWESGEDDGWQAQLWRWLTASREAPHRGVLLQRFLESCRQGNINRDRLPERLCLFGISSFPPAYVAMLAGLAEYTEVHLFLPNPCLAYWGDIVSERDQARLRQLWRRFNAADVSDYFTVGNRLLASLGGQSREFLELLHAYPCEDEADFAPPSGDSLLQRVQQDILYLIERGTAAGPPLSELAVGDRSVQIHSCHSPMRELQVLHDQLLGLFAADPYLAPHDVVVMVPDIDAYAPYVESVFGTVTERYRIPWVTSDRSSANESPLLRFFLGLMEFEQSRLAVTEVLGILELPAVMRRFAIDDQGLEILRHWLVEAGVRWGWDATDWSRLDLPAIEQNTWHFGIRRLLLGYSMRRDADLFAGSLAVPGVEGGRAQSLGSLLSLLDCLIAWRQQAAGHYSPANWAGRITALIEELFQPDEQEEELLQRIRDTLSAFVDETAAAALNRPLDLAVVSQYLRQKLSQRGAGQGFWTGQLTFCDMVPMRAVPFKVVCLIGLNDHAFPRIQRAPSFDLVGQNPQPGDRSRREDDRYLFLEALLSARQVFYISYVGRSIRDNSRVLPSVLVSELLEHIERGFVLTSGELRNQLVTEHPLQPFSNSYLRDGGRVTYAAEWFEHPLSTTGSAADTTPFFTEPLAAAIDQSTEVDLQQLIRFFRNPADYFLRQRLGIRQELYVDALLDTETFALDELASYRLDQELLQRLLTGGDPSQIQDKLRAAGGLPVGPFAAVELSRHADRLVSFAQKIQLECSAPQSDLEIRLAFGDFRLSGWLTDIFQEGLISYRYTKVKSKDQLGLWIRHLAGCAAGMQNLHSRHFGSDGTVFLSPVANAEKYLEQLVAFYFQGLTEPLPFFPKTSLVYAQSRPDTADTKARRAWSSIPQAPGEEAHSSYQLAFRGRDPLGQKFQQIARAIYQPLLDCLHASEQDGCSL